MPNNYDNFLKSLFKAKYKSNDFQSLLSQLKLDDLTNAYGILTGDSIKLKKQEIVNLINDSYLEYLYSVLTNLHCEILNLLFYIVDNQGEVPFKNITHSFTVLLKMTLLAFPVTKDNQYKIVMPDKVYEALNVINREEILKAVEENNIIIAYTRKLVDVYGHFNPDLIFDYLKKYENIQSNYDEKVFLLNSDSVYSDLYDIQSGVIYNYDIEEINNYEELTEKNAHLKLYQLTKLEILGEYYTDEEESLLSFLENNLNMDEDMAIGFIDTLSRMIKIEIDLESILSSIQPLQLNKQVMKQLTDHVKNLYVNTRLFTLKGHTRNEVININKLIPFKMNK